MKFHYQSERKRYIANRKNNHEKMASLCGLGCVGIIKRLTNGSSFSMGWVAIHKAIVKMTCQGSLSIHVLFLVPRRDNCSRRRLICELREIERLLSLPLHFRHSICHIDLRSVPFWCLNTPAAECMRLSFAYINDYTINRRCLIVLE